MKLRRLRTIQRHAHAVAIGHLRMRHRQRRLTQRIAQLHLPILHLSCAHRVGAVHQYQGIRRGGHLKAPHQQLPLAQRQLPVDTLHAVALAIGAHILRRGDVLAGAVGQCTAIILPGKMQLFHREKARQHNNLGHRRFHTPAQPEQTEHIARKHCRNARLRHAHMRQRYRERNGARIAPPGIYKRRQAAGRGVQQQLTRRRRQRAGAAQRNQQMGPPPALHLGRIGVLGQTAHRAHHQRADGAIYKHQPRYQRQQIKHPPAQRQRTCQRGQQHAGQRPEPAGHLMRPGTGRVSSSCFNIFSAE